MDQRRGERASQAGERGEEEEDEEDEEGEEEEDDEIEQDVEEYADLMLTGHAAVDGAAASVGWRGFRSS